MTAIKTNIVKLKIKGEKRVFTTTTEHPFYIQKARSELSNDKEEGEWKTAEELKVGDKVLSKNRKWTPILEINRDDKPTKVYNFEVEENHNYYVGESGVLSHNCEIAMAIAERVVAKWRNQQCLQCANELIQEFGKAGINGVLRELKSETDIIVRAGQNTGEAVATNGKHYGVQVGNKIFDLFHPQGINIDDWAKAFESPFGAKIELTPQ